MKYRLLLTASLTALCVFVVASPVYAAIEQGANSAQGDEQPGVLFGNAGIFSEITNILLFLIGAIAVIMIVIGGLRYVLSGGDAKQVEAAKNTILYAIVGIIVAILAYAVVNFITSAFTGNSSLNTTTGSPTSSTSGVTSTK